MKFKKSVECIYLRSVEVDAESLEEAMDLFDDGDWYDEDCGEGEINYWVAELDEDGEVDSWELIDE